MSNPNSAAYGKAWIADLEVGIINGAPPLDSAKLSLFFPEDYGAKGDNATDDTAAIASAVAAAAASGHGVVWFHPGKTYVQLGTIELPPYVGLRSFDGMYYGNVAGGPGATIRGNGSGILYHITGSDTFLSDNDNLICGLIMRACTDAIVVDGGNLSGLELRTCSLQGSHSGLWVKNGGEVIAKDCTIGAYQFSTYGVLCDSDTTNANGLTLDLRNSTVYSKTSAVKYVGTAQAGISAQETSFYAYDPASAGQIIFDMQGAGQVVDVGGTFYSAGPGGTGQLVGNGNNSFFLILPTINANINLTGQAGFQQFGGVVLAGTVTDPSHVYRRIDGQHIDNPAAFAAGAKYLILNPNGTIGVSALEPAS